MTTAQITSLAQQPAAEITNKTITTKATRKEETK